MPLSTFLNDRAPQRLRGLAFLALSDVAIIERRTATGDSGGGVSYAYAAAGTVACRVDPISKTRWGGPGEIGDRISERSTHFITMPPDTDVTTDDRIAIAGRGTFEVTAMPERTARLVDRVEGVQI